MKWAILLCFVLGAAVMAVLFGWQWNRGVDFKVETMVLQDGKPVFRKGGLAAEDCMGIASEVRKYSSERLSHMIVDDLVAGPVRVYAFSNAGGGSQYTLCPAGLDSWKIIAVRTPSFDPRKEAIESSLPVAP
jgi:hypothetical protein